MSEIKELRRLAFKIGNNQDKQNWPQWLKDARTEYAVIEIIDGKVIWKDGIWLDGVWEDGRWESGIWENGDWLSGTWVDGIWKDGTWKSGEWLGGEGANLRLIL